MQLGRFLFLLVTAAILADAAEPWSQFRGPNSTGVATSPGYPVEFGPKKNMLWRTPVRPGKSSPVLTERHIFLTAHDNGKLFTLCFDRPSGKLLWERSIDRARHDKVHALNEPASTSPVTDGDNVYVFFRDFGLVSYNSRGGLRWKTPLGPFADPEGAASSPIIAGGQLILVSNQSYDGYIAGFDLANGETRWKAARQEKAGWGTPVVVEGHIVAAGSGQMSGYHPRTGQLAWQQQGLAPALVATPAVDAGRLYIFGYGFEEPRPWHTTLAQFDKNNDGKIGSDEFQDNTLLIRLGTQLGDRDGFITKDEWEASMRRVTKPSSLIAFDVAGGKQPRELWRYERSFMGVVPSPLYLNGLVYFVKNGAIFTAMDATTGQVAKAARLPGAAGNYYASLVADPAGIIYAASEKGEVSVIKAGKEWDVIRTNDLGEEIHATPALSGGRIFMRTNEALYCFRP
jgi:outer membrane protein assembly factor BamB